MAVKELQGIDRVKELYKKIPNGGEKTAFFSKMAEDFNMRPISLKSNYFSKLWGIPESKIDEIIIYMEDYNTQNGF